VMCHLKMKCAKIAEQTVFSHKSESHLWR